MSVSPPRTNQHFIKEQRQHSHCVGFILVIQTDLAEQSVLLCYAASSAKPAKTKMLLCQLNNGNNYDERDFKNFRNLTRLLTDIKPAKDDKASLCLSWLINHQLQTRLSLLLTIRKSKKPSHHENAHWHTMACTVCVHLCQGGMDQQVTWTQRSVEGQFPHWPLVRPR